MKYRTCSLCGKPKPATHANFGKLRDGLNARCKKCVNEVSRRFGRDNPDKIYRRWRRYYKKNKKILLARTAAYRARNPTKVAGTYLKNAHGITWAEYQRLLLSQGGRCAICRGTETRKGQKRLPLSVDHDHQSGKIRGLLCNKCNIMLGAAKDVPEILQEGIRYLMLHNKHSRVMQ